MADEDVYGCVENGTYSTAAPNPHVDLAGTIPTGYTIGQLFDTVLDSTDTVTVTVRKDQTNWAVYEGVEFTAGSPDELDLSGATLLDSEGTISNSDSVIAIGLAPRPRKYREIWVSASAMTPRDTNGAQSETEERATNDIMTDHYLFDSITEEGVQFTLAMPDSWDLGTIKAKFFWDADTGASASDGVTWGIAAQAISNDDAIDNAFGASVDTDDTVIAVGDLHVSAASSAITVSGTPALGDLILFEITRVVGDANDDMAEDAKLLGVHIQYNEKNAPPATW